MNKKQIIAGISVLAILAGVLITQYRHRLQNKHLISQLENHGVKIFPQYPANIYNPVTKSSGEERNHRSEVPDPKVVEIQTISEDILNAISALQSITAVAFANTSVDTAAIDSIVKLPKMKSLRFVNCSLESGTITRLIQKAGNGLESLQFLVLDLSDLDVGQIVQCRSLCDIRFVGVPLHSAALKGIDQLPRLKNLGMNRTGIDDVVMPFIVGCPTLEFLDLQETAVSDASVDAICAMKQLKFLAIHGTKITGEKATYIQSQLPGCNVIYDRQVDIW